MIEKREKLIFETTPKEKGDRETNATVIKIIEKSFHLKY